MWGDLLEVVDDKAEKKKSEEELKKFTVDEVRAPGVSVFVDTQSLDAFGTDGTVWGGMTQLCSWWPNARDASVAGFCLPSRMDEPSHRIFPKSRTARPPREGHRSCAEPRSFERPSL